MILNQAEEKIKHFNKIGIHYEAVYHYVIRKREETKYIFNSDFLDDITAGLISFDMQRMMGSNKYLSQGKQSWASKLKQVLTPHRSTLESLQSLFLANIDLSVPELRKVITDLFNDLSKSSPNGLNIRKEGESFPVGATKILHFLIPDFFIIVDSNARRELAKLYNIRKSLKFDGGLYYSAMQHYQTELQEWDRENEDPDFHKLLEIDTSYKQFGNTRKTPLPRIIDKCTFVGDLNIAPIEYWPTNFYISIGGYMGTSYCVEMEDGYLTYKTFDLGYKNRKKSKIIPTFQQWKTFWHQIDTLNIWDWKSNYPNPGICDGTQWKVEIYYDDKQLKSCGDNNYPGVSTRSKQMFQKFFEALRNLLGGVSFS